MKKSFTKLAKSISGISTPFFGVSWNPADSHREIARKLLVFLEDRRALYDPIEIDRPEWVFDSVQQIRKRLSDLLESRSDLDSVLEQLLREMRAACRKYNSMMGSRMISGRMSNIFGMALGELRGVMGVHVARLCVAYGLDIEPQLASILPIDDTLETESENNPDLGRCGMQRCPSTHELEAFFGCQSERLKSPFRLDSSILRLVSTYEKDTIECAIAQESEVIEIRWTSDGKKKAHLLLEWVKSLEVKPTECPKTLLTTFRDTTLGGLELQIRPSVAINWTGRHRGATGIRQSMLDT